MRSLPLRLSCTLPMSQRWRPEEPREASPGSVPPKLQLRQRTRDGGCLRTVGMLGEGYQLWRVMTQIPGSAAVAARGAGVWTAAM
jgi:hypothetical protein